MKRRNALRRKPDSKRKKDSDWKTAKLNKNKKYPYSVCCADIFCKQKPCGTYSAAGLCFIKVVLDL